MQIRSLSTTFMLNSFEDRRPASYTIPLQPTANPMQNQLNEIADRAGNLTYGSGVILHKLFQFLLTQMPDITQHCEAVANYVSRHSTTDFFSFLTGSATQSVSIGLTRLTDPDIQKSCKQIAAQQVNVKSCLGASLQRVERAEEYMRTSSEEAKRQLDISIVEQQSRCGFTP